jgi:hypothetical protein
MRDGLARHVANGWWQVDVDHACGRHEEDVLAGPVRHYVGATAERLDGVAGGVGRGAPGCRRERREFRAGASMRLRRGPSPAGAGILLLINQLNLPESLRRRTDLKSDHF